ncbi:hypothetical protein SNEBB_006781 [Seison nebaliae]|nr:hypothetical protein SNEBB_006781 [Seison nebaliae]
MTREEFYGNENRTNYSNEYPEENEYNLEIYGMFQDVHVMIFIGFGFLMMFLKKYGFSSVGINFLLSVVVIEWALLNRGFYHLNDNNKMEFNNESLIVADFVTAAILISFGALLGKASPTQLVVMAIIEVSLQSLNEWICIEKLEAADIGESMFVHAFGAYFGLSVSLMLSKFSVHDTENEGSVYHSDMFAMIGAIFLFLFWPSFNSAAAVGHGQLRAVVNTFLSIVSSAFITFAISALVNDGKLNMVHIQNATLSGGVAIGSIANLIIEPWAAILVGTVAGILSVIGYRFITPSLNNIVHDTCGVNNLHGMPGIISGIAGIITAASVDLSEYGQSISSVYSALPGRSRGRQALAQAGSLAITLVISIFGGLLTGALLSIPIWNGTPDEPDQLFNDSLYWEVPEDFDEEQKNKQEFFPLTPLTMRRSF